VKAYRCFAFIFISSVLCCAQDSEIYRACSKEAKTQHDLNGCANEEAKRVDVELNKVYKLLLSKVRGNAVATAKIQAAQKAWVAYRDAYIDAMYPAKDKQAEYGSIFPMEVNLLAAKLTRQQIGALQEIRRQNDPQQEPTKR
jgi:uncharacterized protein YecT (DUF1311 family)